MRMVNGVRLTPLDAALPAGISTFIGRAELLGDTDIAMMLQVLDEAERRRAASFRFNQDAAAYVAAHFALRAVLAEALDCEPGHVRFSIGPHGKPSLHPAHDSDLGEQSRDDIHRPHVQMLSPPDVMGETIILHRLPKSDQMGI